MGTILHLKNKRVTVMGLGLHGGGVGVVNWLTRQGANVLVTDLRSKKVLAPSLKKLKAKKIRFVFGRHRRQDFIHADLIIKNPGVPSDSKYLTVARRQGIPIETDISLFFQLCPAPIIGITGTKGKSTTTTLIYEILKRAKKQPVVGGNIRISPLQFLPRIKPTTPVVLELSSWQLEDMEHLHVSPHLAVVTNVLPDHLNRHKNMADYASSKEVIFKYQNKNDAVVLNRDNPATNSFGQGVKSRRYWFSKMPFAEENGCFLESGKLIFRQNGSEDTVCATTAIKLPGEHNVENVLAAVTVVKNIDIPNHYIRKTLETFSGLPDRLELVRTWRGRTFYNDTTATAPDAAIAALRCFKQRDIILLAGGFDKKLSYHALAGVIKKTVVYLILFSGTATHKLLKELKKIHFSHYVLVRSMRQAVQQAWRCSKNGSLILLSPGAASFGMFLNEFDRGRQFKKEVAHLA